MSCEVCVYGYGARRTSVVFENKPHHNGQKQLQLFSDPVPFFHSLLHPSQGVCERVCVCSVLILSSHMVDLLERLEGGEYFLALFIPTGFSVVLNE